MILRGPAVPRYDLVSDAYPRESEMHFFIIQGQSCKYLVLVLMVYITNSKYTTTSMEGDQNGLYTARYCLKGCHRAVRTVPVTKNREKIGLQALQLRKMRKKIININKA